MPPPLDVRVLDELDQLSSGDDLVGELAELFLGDALSQLAILDASLAAHDHTQLAHVAHRLTGSSGNLGATELARLCSLLTASSDPPDFCAAEALILEIRSELQRVRSAFIQRRLLP